MIVDQARYRNGERLPCPDISQVCEEIRRENAESPPEECTDFVWVGLKDPDEEEFSRIVSDELDLHPLAIEDAIIGNQRAKIERYGDVTFAVIKPLRYIDASSDIETGDLMIFLGPDFIVSVRRGEAVPLSGIRQRLQADPEILRGGPTAVFHAMLDEVVDSYLAIEDEIQTDLDEIEAEVFSEDTRVDATQIYRLKREVLEFRRATAPLARPLALLHGPGSPIAEAEMRLKFRDVADHLLQVMDHTESQERLLSDVLSAHLARESVRQNDDMRKISAWVAIAAVPTMIAGIYGMNFDRMPELSASVQAGGREVYYGYYLVLATMALVCFGLYRAFKRARWL